MPTPSPAIDEPAPFPLRSQANDEEVYVAEVEAWAVDMPAFGDQVAAVGANVYDNAVEAVEAAETATTKAGEASASSGTASAAAETATAKAGEASASAGTASAAASAAQNWATKTDGEVVEGQGYGAKKYALDAAASAEAAEGFRDEAEAIVGFDPDDLGTAAWLDTGTADGEVVVVQAGGKLPALDGSDLTGLPGSLTQIGSTTTISSPQANVTFSSGLTAYENLYLELNGVSTDVGSSATLQLEVSVDGSTWSSPFSITAAVGPTINLKGAMRIYNRGGDVCPFLVGLGANLTSPAGGTGWTSVSAGGGIALTGGIAAIRLSYSSGNIDAGVIKLFGF